MLLACHTTWHSQNYAHIQDQAAKEKALAGLSSMSSAQIVSASVLQNTASARMFGTPGIAGNAVPMHTMLNSPGGASPVLTVKHELLNPMVSLLCEVNLCDFGFKYALHILIFMICT